MAKAKRIKGINCNSEAPAGMKLVLVTRFGELIHFHSAALDWSDPEGVHSMRVASRRLRSALFVAYSSQIAHETQCTFDADFCFRIRLRRPSHDQRRAVLDVVKALAALDPAGFGLDDACAQLESSTYVMADEARPHFCVDRMRQQSYREDLVDAIRHPSAVSPDAER